MDCFLKTPTQQNKRQTTGGIKSSTFKTGGICTDPSTQSQARA